MKILKAIKLAKTLLIKNPSIPICRNVLINRTHIMGNTLYTAFKIKLSEPGPAEPTVLDPWPITTKHRDIQFIDTEHVTIDSIPLDTLSADEFPKLPDDIRDLSTEPLFRINSDIVLSLKPFLIESEDERSRTWTNYVFLYLDKTLTLMNTDGRRLHLIETDIPTITSKPQILGFQKFDFKSLLKLAKPFNGAIYIYATTKHIQFTNDDFILWMDIEDMPEPPDYDRVIPEEVEEPYATINVSPSLKETVSKSIPFLKADKDKRDSIILKEYEYFLGSISSKDGIPYQNGSGASFRKTEIGVSRGHSDRHYNVCGIDGENVSKQIRAKDIKEAAEIYWEWKRRKEYTFEFGTNGSTKAIVVHALNEEQALEQFRLWKKRAVCFNAHFLQEFLEFYPTSTGKIYVGTSQLAPASFTTTSLKNGWTYKGVLMPVRLTEDDTSDTDNEEEISEDKATEEVTTEAHV